MSAQYELFETSIGPMVMIGDEICLPSEFTKLYKLAQENQDFIKDFEGFTKELLTKRVNEYLSVFGDGINGKKKEMLIACINAAQEFEFLKSMYTNDLVRPVNG